MQLQRLELLVGKDKLDKIKNTTVLILGIGGVGGYTLESLARSGIGTIIIVDYDIIDITNLNRQIITLHSNIGEAKVEVAQKRILAINPNCHIITLKEKITALNIESLFKYNIDYIIDACDDINTKKILIKECLKRKIKFISCLGMGNKFNPLKLEIMDIRKTTYDPLAKILRTMISKEKIKGKIWVVSSSEKPIKSTPIASNSYVPGIAGLLCSSFVINDIVKGMYYG